MNIMATMGNTLVRESNMEMGVIPNPRLLLHSHPDEDILKNVHGTERKMLTRAYREGAIFYKEKDDFVHVTRMNYRDFYRQLREEYRLLGECVTCEINPKGEYAPKTDKSFLALGFDDRVAAFFKAMREKKVDQLPVEQQQEITRIVVKNLVKYLDYPGMISETKRYRNYQSNCMLTLYTAIKEDMKWIKANHAAQTEPAYTCDETVDYMKAMELLKCSAWVLSMAVGGFINEDPPQFVECYVYNCCGKDIDYERAQGIMDDMYVLMKGSKLNHGFNAIAAMVHGKGFHIKDYSWITEMNIWNANYTIGTMHGRGVADVIGGVDIPEGQKKVPYRQQSFRFGGLPIARLATEMNKTFTSELMENLEIHDWGLIHKLGDLCPCKSKLDEAEYFSALNPTELGLTEEQWKDMNYLYLYMIEAENPEQKSALETHLKRILKRVHDEDPAGLENLKSKKFPEHSVLAVWENDYIDCYSPKKGLNYMEDGEGILIYPDGIRKSKKETVYSDLAHLGMQENQSEMYDAIFRRYVEKFPSWMELKTDPFYGGEFPSDV